MKYDFQAIEKKWQARWEEEKPFAAVTGDPRPKFYGLIEFPYPSGQGLHVGHPRPFTAMDIICRKRRMQGYNVLFPIGFDAFGLPTENYAIKNHIHPAVVTKNNIANFTKQLKMLGYSFDWDRAVDTTDPSYYKWTQWIFLQMYKHGLAGWRAAWRRHSSARLPGHPRCPEPSSLPPAGGPGQTPALPRGGCRSRGRR